MLALLVAAYATVKGKENSNNNHRKKNKVKKFIIPIEVFESVFPIIFIKFIVFVIVIIMIICYCDNI